MGIMRMDKNGEGYSDPTVKGSWDNICQTKRQYDAKVMDRISRVISVIKSVAEIAGFEIVGRITLKDKKTGKEWR